MTGLIPWVALRWTPAVRFVRLTALILGLFTAILSILALVAVGVIVALAIAFMLGLCAGLYFGALEGGQVVEALRSAVYVSRRWRDPNLGSPLAGLGALAVAGLGLILWYAALLDRLSAAELGFGCFLFLGWTLAFEGLARSSRLARFEVDGGKRIEYRDGLSLSAIREYRISG